MPIATKIKITDQATSTYEEIRKQNRSFKEELKSTRSELKATWDKKYKPVVETTSAVKSIKILQQKADTFKKGISSSVHLNDSEIQKLDTMKTKMKAFGNMIVSPIIKIKNAGTSALQSLQNRLTRLGKMVITPVVKIKDMAYHKMLSLIKIFRQTANTVISPILKIKDLATAKINTFKNIVAKQVERIITPILIIKDKATNVLKSFIAQTKKVVNTIISPIIKLKDWASPKLKSLKDNLIFLGKLSIQPIIKIKDLASSSIRGTINGLKQLASKTVQVSINTVGNAINGVKYLKKSLLSLTNRVITPIIYLKDSCTAKLKRITTNLKYIAKTVARPFVVLKDNATAKLTSIFSKMKQLGKKIVRPVISLKDSITNKLSPITSRLNVLNKKIVKPTISILDKTAKGVSSVLGKIGSIAKSVMIPVTIAATVLTAGLGASVKSGMNLENQQVSIEHFIGATNKGYGEDQIKAAAKEFTEQLRVNANATPFETGEVIQAGSRAIAITQGNREQAMDLVKLAEDMASASGGTKSVSDAIEALADAKLGEMERLKEFGFKVSADEFSTKGFSGVSKDLQDFYGGASAKLATTGSGLLSTITGKLKLGVSDFGIKIVEQLKPVFVNVIGFIDKAMPFIEKFGSAFGQSIGKGIEYISSVMPSFIEGFKEIMPTIQILVSGVGEMLPPIMAFGGTIVKTMQDIAIKSAPVITQIIQAINRVLPAVEPIFSQITTFIGTLVTTVLPPLGTAFSMIADVIVAIAPVVEATLGVVIEVVTNIVSGISSVIQGGLDLISSIWSGNWQGVVDSFSTILGGIGEICKAPINAVIGILNGAIDAINSVSIETPDWLPFGLGGKKLGFDLGHIDYLAKGGIVTKATPAVVGEAGKEAVMPLENNTGWINKLAGDITGKMPIGNSVMPSTIPYTPIPIMPMRTGQENKSCTLQINKFADTIIVNNEKDIDKITDQVAEKFKEIADNM